MEKIKYSIWVLFFILTFPLNASTWYVRSATGNDVTGDGSIGNP